MPKRRFTVAERQRSEPIDFEVEYIEKGKNGAADETKVESFNCSPFAPGQLLFEAWDALTGKINAVGVSSFISQVVVEADRARFDRIIRDPLIAVEGQTLVDIADWLVGEYAMRPTEPPSPS